MEEVVHYYGFINSGSPLRIYWLIHPQLVAQNSALPAHFIHNTQVGPNSHADFNFKFISMAFYRGRAIFEF
jgi:hypothetical protein